MSRRAAEAGAAIAYVNQVGGQDELVYDGDPGRPRPVWEQGLMAVDLNLPVGTSDVTGDVDAKDGTTMHAEGFDEALVDRVLRLVDLAEYKRRQYPPGPKITTRAFGRDRRLPITSRWKETPAPVPPEIRPDQTTSG